MSDNISYELQQIQSTLAALTERLAASTTTQVGGVQMYIAVGWSPIIALTDDGTYYYAQIIDWVGGSGVKPPVMQYLCETGWTYNVAEAARVGVVGGGGGGIPDGDKGDITVSSSGTVWTIDARSITAGKLFEVGAYKILGRHTGTAGDAQEISLDTTLEFNSSTLRRAALTGDITASAGSNTTTLANSGVVAGSYGGASAIPVLTIDAKGRITSVSTETPAVVSGGSTNIWLPAAQWIPRTTSGCGVDSRELTTNKINTDELLFDTATQEYAQCMVVFPSNWNAGTITAKFHWTASSGSGGVALGLAARCYADDDALDQAMGTGRVAIDTLIAANDVHISPATSAITIGGSVANGRPVILEVYREVANGSDTLAVDVRLLGVEISYTSS